MNGYKPQFLLVNVFALVLGSLNVNRHYGIDRRCTPRQICREPARATAELDACACDFSYTHKILLKLDIKCSLDASYAFFVVFSIIDVKRDVDLV